MDVVCPKCSTHHRAEPPSSLRSRGAVRFRCTHCGNTFKVEFPTEGGNTATMTLAPAARSEVSLAPVAAAAPVAAVRGYTVRAEGEVYPTTDLATLQRWILECRVKPDDQLSVDGERWERAGGRPDLEIFFAAAERLHVSEAPQVSPRAPVAPGPEDPLAFDPSTVDGPSRDDEDVIAALGGGDADDPVVDSVEDSWGERTQATPDTAGEDLPRIEPDEVTRVSGGDAEPDTQEATMLSVLQERTEEVRKGPVPVRRGYTSLAGQKSLPPGTPATTVSLLPQSMQDMAAEFDVPKPRTVERHEEPQFGDDDEPALPAENPAVRPLIGVVVVAMVTLLAVAGWWITHPAEPAAVAPSAATEMASAPSAPPAAAPEAVAPPAPEAAPAAPEAPAPDVATAEPVVPAVAPTPAPQAQRPTAPPAATPVAAPKPAAPAAVPAVASTTSAPLSANDAVKKGWGLVNKGKYSEAFDVFSKALQKSPGNGSLLYGRGYANEKLGDDVSAAADYCEAKSGAVSEETRRELDGALGRLRRTCP